MCVYNNYYNNNTAQTRCFRLTLLVFLLVTICNAESNENIAAAFKARQTSCTSQQRVVPPTRSIYNPETGPMSMPEHHQTPVAIILGLLTGIVFASNEKAITKVNIAVMSGLFLWWLWGTDFANGGLAIALSQLYAIFYLYGWYWVCQWNVVCCTN